jgi:hypothetical protein
MNGQLMVKNGKPVHFDMNEVRAKAAEQAARLFKKIL